MDKVRDDVEVKVSVLVVCDAAVGKRVVDMQLADVLWSSEIAVKYCFGREPVGASPLASG